MLVLSRKLGERIAIDGEIELEVLEITGNRVRLGISAPQEHRIMRAECLFDGSGTSSHSSKATLARTGS